MTPHGGDENETEGLAGEGRSATQDPPDQPAHSARPEPRRPSRAGASSKGLCPAARGAAGRPRSSPLKVHFSPQTSVSLDRPASARLLACPRVVRLPLKADPAYRPSSSRIGGQRSFQGLAASKAADARRTSGSSRWRPTICIPTGSPFCVEPAGTVAAGWPVMLVG